MGQPFNRLSQFFAALAVVTGVFIPRTGLSQTLAEALDTTNLVWTTGGDVVWFAQTNYTHDGIDAARSGIIKSNQTTWIEVTIIGPATLDYHLGIFHADRRSVLSIIVNGGISEQQAIPLGSTYYWMEHITDLAAGPQTVKWLISIPPDATNAGYAVLDEFQVLPPRPLSFTYEAGDAEIYSGGWAFMSASVIGTPPLQYQWRKDGANIPGATNAYFDFAAATTNNSGNYSVVVSNATGFIVSSNALLTVLPPAPPFFIYEPASVTAYVGQSINLSGSVDGSPPFAFQWRKDGTNFTEMTAASSWGSAWLELTNLTFAATGSYTLFVTNDYGSAESTNAVLTVIPSVAPAITKHPRSLEVAEGVSTWMFVAASGDPEPTYKWTRVGETPPPPPPGPVPPSPVLPPQPKRAFTNVAPTNAGIYFATAKNYGGEVTSREVLLTVLPPITNLSSWWQGAQDVFVTNGLAFLAQDSFGFAILSVSNLAAPVMLGGYNTPGHASGIQANDHWAYVVDGAAGLQIFSVTNPFNPLLVGNYDTPFYLYDLVVRSNLAYLADGKTGLLIVSVSNPAAPTLVGSFKSNFSADYVRVAGDYAYVSSRYSEVLPGTNVAGFFVINVANPSHPFEVGRLARGIGRFDLRDQMAFGVTGSSLEVIAMTNPAQPVVIGSFQTYNYPTTPNWPPRPPSTISALDVQVVNDIAFVGGYSGDESRLFAVDVRDPSEPIPVGYYTNVGQRYALSAAGNMVFFAGIGSPLEVIQTPFATTPAGPPRLTLSPPPGMQLGLHGRRGFHYDIEFAAAPVGFPWEKLQTLLLTNEVATLPITPASDSKFFRLKQQD